MWLKASLFVKTIDAVTQTFDAAVNGLGAIREFVTEKALAVGADSRKNNSLCLAVDEIATNIICYGYPNAGISDNKIDVTVITDENVLTVILEDRAAPFNPMKHTLPIGSDINGPFEDRPMGGLGIMLAQQSVDEFKYEYANNKNRNIFIVGI